MRRTLIGTTLAGLVLGLVACGSTAHPLPQGTVATSVAQATSSKASAAKPVAPAAKSTKPSAMVSTCDAVREAMLTGSPYQILVAMKALQADKSADATAREAAADYAAAVDEQLKKMEADLVRMACAS